MRQKQTKVFWWFSYIWIRLLLNNNVLNTNSNFIPTATEFTQEISYPVFKYLTPGGRSWENYIFYDIYDVVYDSSYGNISIKDAMFNNPHVDYFSKLIFSNHNTDSIKNRSSIAHYNSYKNTIDVIISGLSLSFKLENIAKLNSQNLQ